MTRQGHIVAVWGVVCGLFLGSTFVLAGSSADPATDDTCVQLAQSIATLYSRATRPLIGRDAKPDLIRVLVELELFKTMECSGTLLKEAAE